MEISLQEKASRFPDAPGVYLIRDAAGKVIYVGKARSLRQRVRYYFSQNEASAPRLKALQSQMKDIDCLVTDSEVEALILECTLIKENRPRYNVNLKDDKDYPYLRLTGELYPRLEYLRLSQKRQRPALAALPGREDRYFGPYTNARAMRETMRLLTKLFPLRRCRQPLTGTPSPARPCLNFQMKRCLAPCRGQEAVPPAEYARLVDQAALFLEGRQQLLERDLEQRMQEASRRQAYEQAAFLRDQLQDLRQVIFQEQKVLSVGGADQDVLALTCREREVAVHLFQIREGRLLSQEHFPLAGAGGLSDSEVIAAFLKSYYSRATRIPAELLLSTEPEERQLLEKWLCRHAGRRVLLKVPARGKWKDLVELARRNGLLKLQEAERSRERDELPLKELAMLAGLAAPPLRIEGYDISHLRGTEAVGSMVVFEEGRPKKECYRHFFLRQTPPGDDYAALQEVLKRRFANTGWPPPDLVVIDGGRGQLSAARLVLSTQGREALPLLALSKNPEQIYLEGSPSPVLLPANNTLLQLLQRIRDEAHRFALGYHRRLRHRESTRSLLEQLPGIGRKRRSALLGHFGSQEDLLRATEQQITAVPGFNRTLANQLFRYLHGDGGD